MSRLYHRLFLVQSVLVQHTFTSSLSSLFRDPKMLRKTKSFQIINHSTIVVSIAKVIMARSLAMLWVGDIPKFCGTHQSTTIGGGNLRSGEMLN